MKNPNLFSLTSFWFLVATGLLAFVFEALPWDSISHIMAIFIAGLLWYKFARLGFQFSKPFIFLLLAYILWIIFAAIIAADPSNLIISAKYYLFFIPLCVVLSGFSASDDFSCQIVSGWSVIFYFQIPFLLFQYFIVFPRTGNWDVMTGTFGGSQEGGGNSGGMAIFLLAYASLRFSAMVYRLISMRQMAFEIVVIFLIAALAEVKVVLILFPLVVFLSIIKFDMKSIVLSFVIIAVGLYFSEIVLNVYAKEYYGTEGGGILDVLGYVAEEFLDPDYMLLESGDLGRLTALNVWWKMNTGDQFSLLFGHGLMSIKEGSVLPIHSISTAYQYKLGGSSLVFLLWDFGLLGCGMLIIALLYGSARAFLMTARHKNPAAQFVLRWAGVSLLIITITLPYSNSLIDTAQTKWILACAIAIAFRASRRNSESCTSAGWGAT